jgi:glutamate racemase
VDAGADTLVLGCTHYPFLRDAIEAVAGRVEIIETGPAVARELLRRLGEVGAAPAPDGLPALRLQSSADEAKFTALAARLLGPSVAAV